jgi:hypothetical protein
MKKVTRYEANDGTEFNDAERCIAYEKKIKTTQLMHDELYLRDVDIDALYDWVKLNITLFE